MMPESPFIETPRLRIIPFPEEYLTPRYVGWLNDPMVVRYSEQRHKPHTLESCRRYWQSFIGSPHIFWAVTAVEPPLGHIGNMNAHIDTANSIADVGVLIGERTVWGKGYGFEAWVAVCDYLLHDVGIRKVTAGAVAANKGMIRIMEKAGMVADGRRLRQYMVDSLEVDVIYMALFGNRVRIE